VDAGFALRERVDVGHRAVASERAGVLGSYPLAVVALRSEHLLGPAPVVVALYQNVAVRIILAFAELDVASLEAGKFPLTKPGAGQQRR
jgi:hypothetical protein